MYLTILDICLPKLKGWEVYLQEESGAVHHQQEEALVRPAHKGGLLGGREGEGGHVESIPEQCVPR